MRIYIYIYIYIGVYIYAYIHVHTGHGPGAAVRHRPGRVPDADLHAAEEVILLLCCRGSDTLSIC